MKRIYIYMGEYLYCGDPITKNRIGQVVKVYRGSWQSRIMRNALCVFDDGFRTIRPFRGLRKYTPQEIETPFDFD